MSLRRKVIIICLGLFIFGLTTFLIGISEPPSHSFDEFHYVPSAIQFLDWRPNQNWEHPPLGKMLMAVGIGIFGDNPLGWRVMSTIFGALTLVGMFAWGYAVFASVETALWVALLSFCNNLLYVQARIGMLDTFMMAFLVWAFAAICLTWRSDLTPKQVQRCFDVAGILFGFAMACKWFGVIPLAACFLMVVGARVLQYWKTRFDDARPDEDWYRPTLWKNVTTWGLVRAFFVYPFLAYYVTFVPLILIEQPALGPLAFFPMQYRMWDGQLRVVNSHPYMSNWPGWPFLLRPIWYAFEQDKDMPGRVRGVLLLGNPLIMWSGLLALGVCAWEWIRYRARDAFIILAFYVILYASWAVIPRKVSFYYYYYPAGMTLSLALAYVFHPRAAEKSGTTISRYPWARWLFLGIAASLFIYFLPILSGMSIPSDAFRKWMWFRTWI